MDGNYPDDATYQLWHTYEFDGDPGDLRTVVARNVGSVQGACDYVMLARPDGGADVRIYPVEWDADGEALLLPPCDLDDVDRDGSYLPYWVNIHECVDVSDRFPGEFPPNRI